MTSTQPPTQNAELAQTFNDLKLEHCLKAYGRDLESMSENERHTLEKYLISWLKEEQSNRWSARIETRIKAAKFVKIQTVDGFNFQRNKSTKAIEKDYLALLRGISKTSLPSAVFTGHAGQGKTHLARALGYAACQCGLTVLFVGAAQMVNHLSAANKAYNLETELKKYRKPQVLIIDELGYVSMGTEASHLFFQVISARHDNELGTITTTNLPFGKFNQVFANDAVAHAIVDRLANDGEVFYLEGEESYREHQRKQKVRSRKKSS